MTSPAPHANGENGLSLLLVESDPQVAVSLAAWLQMLGHRVAVSGDGIAALDQAHAEPPDVVLVEVNLPAMDGWEIVRRLSAQCPPRSKRPFFIATAWHVNEIDYRRAGESGVDLFLEKPLDLVFLRKLLSRFQRVLSPGQTLQGDTLDVAGGVC